MRKQRYKGQDKLPSDTETDKEALTLGSGVLALRSPCSMAVCSPCSVALPSPCSVALPGEHSVFPPEVQLERGADYNPQNWSKNPNHSHGLLWNIVNIPQEVE